MEEYKNKLKKQYKSFLVDTGKTEKQLASELNTTNQNLNQKINNGTIKYIELLSIFEKYGYTLQLIKIKEKLQIINSVLYVYIIIVNLQKQCVLKYSNLIDIIIILSRSLMLIILVCFIACFKQDRSI